MHNIIAYIPRNCESAALQQAAEELRIYIMKNDIKDANIIICASTQTLTTDSINAGNAELFRMKMKEILPDIPVTIFNQKEKKSGLTIQEIAEQFVATEQAEVYKLIKLFRIPERVISETPYQPDHMPYKYKQNKHDKFVTNRAMKQFNVINQRRKQFLSNQTKHK